MPGVALIQVWVSLFVPLNYHSLSQSLYLWREEGAVSYVSGLTATTGLSICVGWFAVDIFSENETGSYYKEHWIMISSLEYIPLVLICDISLF